MYRSIESIDLVMAVEEEQEEKERNRSICISYQLLPAESQYDVVQPI
jgi:hypothetical protein